MLLSDIKTVRYMKKLHAVFILLILTFSLIIRYSGIKDNHPLWVDEYSSAIQGQIFQSFTQDLNYDKLSSSFERNNFFSHILIAKSLSIFGESERAVRFPFFIIGSLFPIVVFLTIKKLFGTTSAIVASILITTSYFEIAWSIQARGYILQQLLSTSLFFSYIVSTKKSFPTPGQFLLIISLSILGILTHNIFILPIFALFIHFVLYNFQTFLNVLKKPMMLIPTFIVFVIFGYMSSSYKVFSNDLFDVFNNVWYYHALLWREYGLIIFLALIGAITGFNKNNKATSLFVIFISVQLIFVTFFFGHYMSKYILPVFHLILILSGMGIVFIGNQLSQTINRSRFRLAISLFLTALIVFNGDKFVVKPKAFYSVNHDMRDIALVDYNRIYEIVNKKTSSGKKFAMIETWPDRAKWYFRDIEAENIYWFRWIDGGFRKKTTFYENNYGEKIVVGANTKLVAELSDLFLTMEKYPHGFIWIDDTSLPTDVISYAKENFKEEIYLEHYQYDDDPYSVWPGTLYSWGFDD